jgi:RND family efflux transporter MFP subunit
VRRNRGPGARRTALGIALLALGALAGCRKAETTAPPPPAVTVAAPTRESVADYLDFTGNTAALNTVTVVARVEGYLEKVHFTDGAIVKKDDLLFTIQQDQYQAQLQQAQAQVQAQKVAFAHAETELGRYSALVKQDAATQTTVDHWKAQRDTAAAELLGAQAQVALAELNLGYTLVRSPLDGRIGRHLVDPGNLVGTMGQPTSLAEIQQLDPIYVYFTIDERDLLRIMRQRTHAPEELARVKTPAAFGLLTEEGFPHEGALDFAAVGVAPTTGTLQVRGVFPNADLGILPGLFVRVRVHAPQARDALLVPGDAVAFDQQGEYVLVVNAQNVIERRGVKTGQQVGDRLVITEGLQPTDAVVVEGLLQAVPGRTVTPERAAAAVSPAPTPATGT